MDLFIVRPSSCHVFFTASWGHANPAQCCCHKLLSQHTLCICLLNISQIYNEERRRFSLVRNQPRKIVEKVASDIENLLAKKRKALDVSMMRLIDPAGTKTRLFLSAASDTILHKSLNLMPWTAAFVSRMLRINGVLQHFWTPQPLFLNWPVWFCGQRLANEAERLQREHLWQDGIKVRP